MIRKYIELSSTLANYHLCSFGGVVDLGGGITSNHHKGRPSVVADTSHMVKKKLEMKQN